ncbi:type II toxin-antitoxin system VapC family toxin [Deinococcus sp. VB343]|uniref:Type II toxin-antitoxin system VapC family toxin n=1 Tax=Deinococcus sp. VB142 TaxID=3112952 RepID=A0AAU6Q662_9DEIO
MSEIVLDASAVLAWMKGETGAERVEAALGGYISTVNLAEVTTKSAELGYDPADIRLDLVCMGLRVVPFSAEHSDLAAKLRPLTRVAGLSLGDRACLALALSLGLPVLTADKAWASLEVGVTVDLLRGDTA